MFQSVTSVLGLGCSHSESMQTLSGLFLCSLWLCVSCGCKPYWLSQLDVLGAHLLGVGLKSWGARFGVQTFPPQGETQGCEIPPNCRLPCRHEDSGDTVSHPFLPTLCGFFFLFVQYVGATQFLTLFQRKLFYLQLQIWCVHVGRCVQDPPTSLSFTGPWINFKQ